MVEAKIEENCACSEVADGIEGIEQLGVGLKWNFISEVEWAAFSEDETGTVLIP